MIHCRSSPGAFLVHLVVVVVALAGSSSAEPAEDSATLTLDDAIRAAVENDSALRAVRASSIAAEARVEIAKSARRPQLDLELGAQSTDNPVLVFSQKLLQGEFTSSDFALDELNNPSFHEDLSGRAVVRQAIWTGGRLRHGIESARWAAMGFERRVEFARQSLVQRVSDDYAAVIVGQKQREVLEQALSTANAHTELARSLFENGLVVESDVLRAEVQASTVRQSLTVAEADLEIAETRLNLDVGLPAATELELESDAMVSSPGMVIEASSLEEHVAAALENRSDLVALRAFQSAADSEVAFSRVGRRPQLGLEASLEAHGADLGSIDGSNAMIGLGLRIPLFQGGRIKASIAASQALADQRLATREVAEDRIELEVRSAWSALRAAQRRVELARQETVMTERSLEIVEDRYRHGLTTLVDLLDTQTQRTTSELRELQSHRDVLLARIALRLATGQL